MSSAAFESLASRVLFSGGLTVPPLTYPFVPMPDAPSSTKSATTAGRIAVDSRHRLTVSLINSTSIDISQRGSRTRLAYSIAGSDQSEIHYVSNVHSLVVNGTDGADVIHIGAGLPATTVYAGGGDDVVIALAGGTRSFYGGAGNDRLYGGNGNDALYGEAGDDRLYGAGGDDLLDGGAGKDYLTGGTGRNHLIGGTGSDRIDLVTTDDKLQHDSKDKIIAAD